MPVNRASPAFVDTNIWLYAFIEADDAHKSATARHLLQNVDPVISTQVINEVAVNLLRKAHFSEEQLRQLIESFFTQYPVIDGPRPPDALLDAAAASWDDLPLTVYAKRIPQG